MECEWISSFLCAKNRALQIAIVNLNQHLKSAAIYLCRAINQIPLLNFRTDNGAQYPEDFFEKKTQDAQTGQGQKNKKRWTENAMISGWPIHFFIFPPSILPVTVFHFVICPTYKSRLTCPFPCQIRVKWKSIDAPGLTLVIDTSKSLRASLQCLRCANCYLGIWLCVVESIINQHTTVHVETSH